MKVNKMEVEIYGELSQGTAVITKHYNESVRDDISLTVDDVYALEFIVSEIKRKLKLI